MSEPPKRRRRPAVACILCRKRKIKCDRKLPCNNCTRSRTGDCAYETWPAEAPEQVHNAPSKLISNAGQWKPHQPILPSPCLPASRAKSTFASLHSSPKSSTQSPPDSGFSHEIEAKRLRLRIRELEDQLSRVSMESSSSSPLATTTSSIETTTSKLGGVFHVQCENPIGNGGPIIARSMMHKTRMFGQSHWCVTGVLLIRDIFETIDAQLQERGAEAWAGIARCKGLARFIKTRRSPPWPPTKVSPLPEKPLADRLVENYLQNIESLYRVLHIPTFREQYDALWAAGAAAPDAAFLVQVKLVLALGAVTYDEAFSLRTCAMQWAYEAQLWLTEPKFKARLDIQTVQTNILLLFAQERLGIIADSMWISVGWLVRRVMYMGLHRDPARLPERTVLTCEMHRRLWNTIAELNLQSSLGSGGPVFLSMSDFDTKAPGNFDDEQLLELDPVSRPPHECTQMTMALALRETFSQRLDALRFLNDVSSGGSYEETLRLDGQLRASYKALGRRLQSCRGQGAKQALTSTELRVLDIIMYRYLTALHVPYFVAAMQDARYAYSRVVVVDCALKIWTSLAGRTWMHASSCAQSTFEAADDLRRQVTGGMSFFMIAAMHSALLIVMELRAQLKESDGLGPKLLRPDLLAVLEQCQEWSLEVIKSGHTNVKGYLLMRIIAVQIDGMSQNLSQDALVENLLGAAMEVSETCGGLLTEMAEKLTGGDSSITEAAAVPMPTPPDMSGEWTFTGLDDLFACTETKTGGWPASYGYSMNEFEWAMFDA